VTKPKEDDIFDATAKLRDEKAAEQMDVRIFQEFSNAFDTLTQQRHEAGAEEYGHLTFIGNDVIRMMAEELADTANYCRYQFIKLMMLQELLEDELSAKGLDGEVKLGGQKAAFQGFKGVGEVGWQRP
jgi:hypothetical protein